MPAVILELARGHITFRIGERTATVQGEMLIRGPSVPNYVIYTDTLTRWHHPFDTAPLAPGERHEILEQLRTAAMQRDLVLAFE